MVKSERGLVRIPYSEFPKLKTFYEAQRILTQELGREPTNEEILNRAGLNAEFEMTTLRALRHMASLDQPRIDDEEEVPLIEKIGDDKNVDIAKKVIGETTVAGLLEDLTPDQREVVILRVGLDGHNAMQFNEIGDVRGGKSRQAAQDLYRRAINKLRKDPEIQKLRNSRE
ncbi:hypothetical protein C4559_03920 [Candidatus Microgenomates bacterium]|nr:MAG: hypothetical protein C4559_03920 [Candidatus Microgenomates bacterium]